MPTAICIDRFATRHCEPPLQRGNPEGRNMALAALGSPRRGGLQ
jgi:hypothetical protein